MKNIEKRTFLSVIFTALLVIGMLVFCFRFFVHGGSWASFPANRHLYNNQGQLKGGTILDRDGDVLSSLDENGKRTYYDDASVRKATLHAVGDPEGNIGSGATSAFADKLSGYNPITGAYSALGTGNHLYLTIDAYLNNVAYQALGSNKGAVSVYNYKTGEVLCMVSTPTFDPVDPPYIEDGDERYNGVYVNRVLSATTTPGSIFKVVTLQAAIENIPDLYSRTWTCTGAVNIGGSEITCPYAHGTMDIEGALAKSCNGVFGQLAVELGSKDMMKYTEMAGLTSMLSISGIPSARGSFEFDSGEHLLAWAGVGQNKDLLCPVNMMTYMGAIGNGGKAAVPRLIHATSTSYGFPTGFYPTKQTDKLIEASTASAIADMMHNNVIETYGVDRFSGMDICAKSGTAETSPNKSPNAWFAGFLRDSSTPYAFIVMVEEGGGGASVAGSIASTVLQEAVAGGY